MSASWSSLSLKMAVGVQLHIFRCGLGWSVTGNITQPSPFYIAKTSRSRKFQSIHAHLIQQENEVIPTKNLLGNVKPKKT